MKIFDKFDLFPEISDVKFIPVSKLESKPGVLIHLGLATLCPGKTKITKRQQVIFNNLYRNVQNRQFENLDFLSFNDLKTRSDEFCHECSDYALYFKTSEGYGFLEDFFDVLEKLKNFLESEQVETFTFYNDLLIANLYFIEYVSFISDEKNKSLSMLINPLQTKLNGKLKEISDFLKKDSFVLNLKKDNVSKAAASFLDSSLIEPGLEEFFVMQKRAFEEKLLISNASVVFSSSFDLDFLQSQLKSPLQEGKITEEEAIFLIKMTLMYSLLETDFVVMPYVLFLTRNEILGKITANARVNKNDFVIIEGEADEKILEMCRSLHDRKNPTFETYEKVYNIAINL